MAFRPSDSDFSGRNGVTRSAQVRRIAVVAIVPSTSQRAQTSLVPWQRRDPMPTTASLSILLGGALLIVAIGVFWIGIEPQPGDDGFISFSACFAAGVAALLYGISKATVHARRSKNYV